MAVGAAVVGVGAGVVLIVGIGAVGCDVAASEVLGRGLMVLSLVADGVGAELVHPAIRSARNPIHARISCDPLGSSVARVTHDRP